jgi:hypothetical protein
MAVHSWHSSTEKTLISYKVGIHEMIDRFNSRSRECVHRRKRCSCILDNNESGSCDWPYCPLGEEKKP